MAGQASQELHCYNLIDRLLPELLSKIFVYCVALWPFQNHHDFTCGNRLPWIAIAQVCMHWRSVALACGELWRRLIFSSPEATTEMLRRSKGSPLIVKTDSDLDYENVRMVIPEIGRVAVLHLGFSPSFLQSFLQDISVASPKLESLRLRAGVFAHDSDFEFSPPFNIPDMIFAGHTPSLCLVDLIHCRIPWNSPLFQSGLTHLELHKTVVPPTMTQILSLLRGVPMLNTLILDRALPTCLPNDTYPDVTSPRQFLPHLRILTLGGSVNSCNSLLEHIAYPMTTIATFHCKVFSGWNTNIHNFLLGAQSAIRYRGGDRIIQSLGIAQTYDHLILRCFITCRSAALLVPSQENPQLNVLLQRRSSQFVMAEVMRTVVVTLPLAEVQTLHVSGQGMFEMNWSDFLRHMPNIHTIHFHQEIPPQFMKVLTHDEEETTEPTRLATCLLSRLRSLRLNGIRFYWEKDTFLAYLYSRVQIGLAIQELHLEDCWDLYEEDVQRMRESVDDVHWDGVEQMEDEDYVYEESGGDFEGIDDSD